ncbi:DUF4870 domain-containing protein [Haloarcula sp. S1CR25-12]|uniref:DUF4870 domain-containing protein n=1 Tax=Haloarcula saliterrae TaxID=2950534 RepID=A0ABU2FFC5_9EURY|nr:DUF4870 domain-containing protein [Haloarcula sp. S1CR25-12]MDS0260966.1 DUF4870 domain-containing protein [Haloarcula sp. S1CR25-12]
MTANSTGRRNSPNQNTTIAALVHVAGLFFGFVAIAFAYLVTDDEFTKANAANALNWHVPVALIAVPVAVIGVVVSETAGVAIAMIIAIGTICFALIASMKAYRGRAWKYPLVPSVISTS